MTLKEFEKRVMDIRAKNGWTIILECRGIWVVKIHDKYTDKLIASTGSTGLYGIIEALKMPLDKSPWI